ASAVALLARRRVALAALVVAAVEATSVLTLLFKWAVGRARPNSYEWLIGARGTAFPSGHAAKAAALYGALAIVISAMTHRRVIMRAAWGVATIVVAAVGASRVYLDVHWASDVAGGWLLGLAVLPSTWLVIAGLTRPRTATAVPADRSSLAVG